MLSCAAIILELKLLRALDAGRNKIKTAICNFLKSAHTSWLYCAHLLSAALLGESVYLYEILVYR